MNWRVEIKYKKGVFDSQGHSIQKAVSDLGITSVQDVSVEQVYNIKGGLTEKQIKSICRELLVDEITQEYLIFSEKKIVKSFAADHGKRRCNLKDKKLWHPVEISYNPGVMDPVEQSAIKGIKDLGFKNIISVTTAKKYFLYGDVSNKEIDTVVNKILSNRLIQHVVNFSHCQKIGTPGSTENIREIVEPVYVNILKASDRLLIKLSKEGQLFLNFAEMKAIQKHFREKGRNPTDCELETIAQTWSEHCYHKTFRGNIRYRYSENGKKKTKIIRNLLKSTIMKATKEIDKSWCVSVFHDNAGVIRFDKDLNICFKAETHNHPSALEPFGGANTGIGGVIRDILGTGLGAKPICSTDVFCFAPHEMAFSELPPGTLHPKRIMKGVVGGVRDYGNKMGIPIVNGAILFDQRFVGNPLVFCGNVGIMPRNKVNKKVFKNDLVLLIGGKTGRDGIHGATFSSGELTDKSEKVSSGAVQIGDPIQEKKVLDALMQARDQGLYTAITDCGAGGLSSAVGEMGEALGVHVDLEKVPLKYQGLNYDEIWISESQERMVLSVKPANIEKILKVFFSENVEATVIGKFTGSKRLELFYYGCRVCDLDMYFLYDGTPNITKDAYWAGHKANAHKVPRAINLNKKLFEVLSHHNVCSKEWVIRQYDHEVQGTSVIKPLIGVNCDGPSDAGVIAPRYGSSKGIAVSNGINILYGKIDPFWMAASCIDEAIRQIVAVGGDIEKIAILDNFCWGNPDKPDRLGGLVRAAEGCYKISVGYKVPFISGKDSLYNEYVESGKSISIPGTLLISAIGIINDVTKTVTMDFKESGNLVYCVGETFDELGGSIYLDTFKLLGNFVPRVDTKRGMEIFTSLFGAVKKGLVRSMHDCSEGGIGVALAEMAFSGGFGLTARLDKVPYKGKDRRGDTVLFSESNSRFIVEVAPSDQKAFERSLRGIKFGAIGRIEENPEFVIYGLNKQACVNVYIQDIKDAWQRPLRW